MKPLNKDLFRELKKSLPRFISILLLVCLGVFVLVGLAVSGPMMRHSLESKLTKAKMYDLYIHNSLGLNDKDLDLLAHVEGLDDLEFRYAQDRLTQDGLYTIRLLSMTKNMGRPLITKGQAPLVEGELALDEDLAKTMGLKLGDQISFQKKESKYQVKEAEEEQLTTRSFILVGLCQSAEHVKTTHKGTSDVGTSLDGFAYISPNSFTMDQPTDALMTLKGTGGLKTWSDDYKVLVDKGEESLKNLFKDRPKERLDLLKADIQEDIDTGKQEVKDGEEKLQEAKDKLDQARNKLAKGQADYQSGKSQLNKAIQQGEQDLAQGRDKLESGRSQVSTKEQDLTQGEQDLAKARKTLKDQEETYKAGRADFVAGMDAYYKGKDRLDQEEEKLKAGENQLKEKTRELEQGEADYQAGLAKWQEGKRQLDSKEGAILDGRRQIEEARKTLQSSKEKLDQAQGKIESKRAQVQGGVNQANAAYQAAQGHVAEIEGKLNSLPADAPSRPQLEGALNTAKEQVSKAKGAVDKAQAGLSAFEQGVKPEEAKIQEGLKEYQAGLNKFKAQEVAFQEGERAYLKGKKDLDQSKAQLDQARDQILQGRAQIQEGKAKIQDGSQEIMKGRSKLADSYKELEKAKGQLEDGRQKLDQAKAQLDKSQEDLSHGKSQLDQAKATLASSERKLNEGANRLAREKSRGQAKLQKAKADLNQGKKDLAQGEEDFEEESTEARADLDQAKMDIQNAGDILEILNRPIYTIYSRLNNPGLSEYLGYADSMDKLVYVFPLFFFAISMLVSLTTMTRMVEDHRTFMGTLKALGFKKQDIGRKFTLYGGLAALFGGILGALGGNYFIGPIIGNAYSTGTIMKPIEVDAYPKLWLLAILVGIFCTSLVAYVLTRRSLKETAANLMRPKAPRQGKRIFLERLTPLWKRLNFLQKVTARNIFRYKTRMFMTLAGIMGCMALLVLGFGIWSAVNGLVDKQFTELTPYDVILVHERALSKESYQDMVQDLEGDSRVAKKVKILYSLLTMEKEAGGDRDISLMVTEGQDFSGLVSLQKPRGQAQKLPKRGALITEKLAKQTKVKPGETLSFKDDQGIQRKVTVVGLVENYAGHYIYMTKTYYEDVFNEPYKDNGYLIDLKGQSKDQEADFVSHFQSYKAVLAVTSFDQVRTMVDQLVGSLNVVVTVILVLSSTLAIVVLYNLSNINIEERIRELSTIKVLGFFPKEVTAYIYRETWILTLLGIVLGAFTGKLLHYGVLQVVVPDNAMLYPVLKPWNYLLPALITLAITFFVMVLVHRYLKKIDMVEALKGVD